MDDIDLGLDTVFSALLSLLSGGVGARVEGLAADLDHLAVGLVYNAVDLLEVVDVGDDLVIGKDVLLLDSSISDGALGMEYVL